MTPTPARPDAASLTQKGGGTALPTGPSPALALVAGLLVLAILALILFTTVKRGDARPSQKEGLQLLHQLDLGRQRPGRPGRAAQPQFGALAFIFGTLVVSLIGLLFAVPVAIGHRAVPHRAGAAAVRALVVTVIDLLAACPRSCSACGAFSCWRRALVPVYGWVHDARRRRPGARHDLRRAGSSGR